VKQFTVELLLLSKIRTEMLPDKARWGNVETAPRLADTISASS
jgi:hypothetical protein